MIISSIRYRSPKDGLVKTYRFTPGSGRLANMVCVHERAGESGEIFHALHLALSGTSSGSVKDVALMLTDDNQKNWIIERGERGTRCLCDGQPATQDQIDRTLLGALFEYEASAHTNAAPSEDTSVIFREIHHEFGDWSSFPHYPGNEECRLLRAASRQRTEKLTEQASAILREDSLKDPRQVLQLAREITPLIHALHELCEQRETIKARWGQDFSPDNITKLRAEVELLKRMQGVAAPLIEPANNPGVIRDKLQKVEASLRQMLDGTGLSDLKRPLTDMDWPTILDTLSRKDVFQRLCEASTKAREIVTTQVKDALKKYEDVCVKNLRLRADGAAELESCLASLALQVRDVTEHARQSRGILDKCVERVRWMTGIMPAVDDQAEAAQIQRVENARHAIDFASKSIRELARHVNQPREQEAQALARIDEISQRLDRELGDVTAKWQALVAATGLSKDLTLTQCLKLLSRYTRIADLAQRRQTLNAQLDSRKEELARLSTLVLEWRQMTGSHKTTALDNESILIPEARNLLHYLPEKEKQVARVDSRREDTMIGVSLGELTTKRENALLERFQSACQASRLANPPAWNDPRWTSLMDIAREISGLALFQQDGDRLASDKALSPPSLGTLFMIHRVPSGNLTHEAREDFLKLFVEGSSLVFQVLLISDHALVEHLTAKGTGKATYIPPAPNTATSLASATPRVIAPTIPTRPAPRVSVPEPSRAELLALRAKTTVDILNGKR